MGGNPISQAEQRSLVNGLRASLDVALSAESLASYSTRTRLDLLAVLREHAAALEASLPHLGSSGVVVAGSAFNDRHDATRTPGQLQAS